MVPARLAPDDLTDKTTYGRLLNRLGNSRLGDTRWGFGRIRHPTGERPETGRAAHERAVVECAWARLRRIAVDGLRADLPPVDHHDFQRGLPHPNHGWGYDGDRGGAMRYWGKPDWPSGGPATRSA